jgi:hypothetical protein
VLLIATTVWLGIQVVVEADVNVDEWWNVFVDRFAFLDGVALAMNFLGGGWFATFVVPLAGVALLLFLRRPRGALFVVVASLGSVALVQLLKALFGRARPEDMIVFSDHGSFLRTHRERGDGRDDRGHPLSAGVGRRGRRRVGVRDGVQPHPGARPLAERHRRRHPRGRGGDPRGRGDLRAHARA